MPDGDVARKIDRGISCVWQHKMKKTRFHFLSYIAALVIGTILFATIWKWLFGPISDPVLTAGITGVVVAVIIFLVWNELKKPKDGNN